VRERARIVDHRHRARAKRGIDGENLHSDRFNGGYFGNVVP
jgi:hypothetical protein